MSRDNRVCFARPAEQPNSFAKVDPDQVNSITIVAEPGFGTTENGLIYDHGAAAGTQKATTVKETSHQREQLNVNKPLSKRKSERVNDEEYARRRNDWEDILGGKCFSIEGLFEFRALLFVPRCAPLVHFESKKKRDNIRRVNPNQLVLDFQSGTHWPLPYRIASLRGRVGGAHNQEELVRTTRDQLRHLLTQHISASRKLSKIVKAGGLTIVALILALHFVLVSTLRSCAATPGRSTSPTGTSSTIS